MSFATATSIALLILGLAVLAGLAAFGVVSIRERERRSSAWSCGSCPSAS